jgi:hypothetical protein
MFRIILTAFSRASHLLLLVFILVAMAYTTAFLLLCPFIRDCPNVLSLRKLGFLSLGPARLVNCAHDRPPTAAPAPDALSHADRARALLAELQNGPYPDRQLDWPAPVCASGFCDVSVPGAFSQGAHLEEQLFLAKAFASSLQPMHAIPFFHRAPHVPDPDDITITTLVTPNRYEVLRRLAERHDGPSCSRDPHLSPSPRTSG